ncbi:hypothetical protein [Schinkia azotoformans]|uniref:hypothetical protein n=1 Tax=Schinkia azotoformans TaxID=1454 RepID=UPI002DBEC3C1|nr:hypothetical protein [Schinkia azotoformans]MEC1744104.1 hypothetical protein [Schinkia azotoformans]
MLFILGEKREVKIKITSTKNEPFTIRNAQFELIKRGKGKLLDGKCKVEDKEISILIQPPEEGSYILQFSYEIANEVLKANVPIEVNYYAKH